MVVLIGLKKCVENVGECYMMKDNYLCNLKTHINYHCISTHITTLMVAQVVMTIVILLLPTNGGCSTIAIKALSGLVVANVTSSESDANVTSLSNIASSVNDTNDGNDPNDTNDVNSANSASCGNYSSSNNVNDENNVNATKDENDKNVVNNANDENGTRSENDENEKMMQIARLT